MRNVELRTGVCRGYAVVVLCGELDTRDAGETAAAVAALAAGGQQLIIDLETLDFIDCHAADALLGVRATARQAGGDVLLAAPHGPVLRLLTVPGAPDPVVVPTVEEPLTSAHTLKSTPWTAAEPTDTDRSKLVPTKVEPSVVRPTL